MRAEEVKIIERQRAYWRDRQRAFRARQSPDRSTVSREELREANRLAFRQQVATEVAALDLQQLARDLHGKDFRDAHLEASLAWAIRTQVRLIREDRGWTQRELAEKSGVSYAAINRLENLSVPFSVNIGTLLDIAEAFDCALVVRFESWSNYLAWLAEVKATKGASLIPKPFPETAADLALWATANSDV